MDEFKDDIKEPKSEEELLDIGKKSDPDYDPDDDLQFEISPVAAAFIGLAGGFFLYQIVGSLLTILIFGLDLESIPVNSLRLMTMAGQILFILLPALLFSKWIYTDVGKIIRIRKPDFKELGFFTVGIIILTPLLQSLLYIQNYYIEIWAKNIPFINSIKTFFDEMNKMVEKTYGNLLSASNVIELLLVITVVAVVPALSEESLFRGFIQRSFELKYKKYIAAIITALFFSAYHFNPYGFIPLFILGAYFGFASYKSKTLLIPMFLHFLNNFSAVILYYIIGDDELIKSDPTTNPNELSSYVMMFFALSVLFVGLIIFINKYYTSKKILKEN
ncbi:MAG TPA: CPBP family glutamic-type intramembrane protease [Ignavibacteriaceae bacterium]|nr:CPBP family glutamic-type intramembrane protease [Ignavibacteriaceae bacterium]HRP92950.1 CPBP family glutamic-type intramembrane protease [Ignavibacteriaceae bacterium]